MSIFSIFQAPESKARQFHWADRTLASNRSNEADLLPMIVKLSLSAESPSQRKGWSVASAFNASPAREAMKRENSVLCTKCPIWMERNTAAHASSAQKNNTTRTLRREFEEDLAPRTAERQLKESLVTPDAEAALSTSMTRSCFVMGSGRRITGSLSPNFAIVSLSQVRSSGNSRLCGES